MNFNLEIKFSEKFARELKEWKTLSSKYYEKIIELIAEIQENPFKGRGKPEPLKGNRNGQWSRRITSEHRLIYIVDKNQVIFLSCKGHYS